MLLMMVQFSHKFLFWSNVCILVLEKDSVRILRINKPSVLAGKLVIEYHFTRLTNLQPFLVTVELSYLQNQHHRKMQVAKRWVGHLNLNGGNVFEYQVYVLLNLLACECI